MFAREATTTDIDLVLRIFNEHNMSVAPELGTNGVAWAEEFIAGYPDVNPAWILFDKEGGEAFAIGNLNPNSNSKRFQVDISILPESDRLDEALGFFREQAKGFGDGWKFWITCNLSDERFNQLLIAEGFKVNRHFNSLRRELNSDPEPELPPNTSVRQLDLNSDSELKIMHTLLRDAFSKHFGFVPRPFEEYLEIARRDNLMKISQVYLISENDVPAGYILINDEVAHELTGYVQNLGVSYAFQGKGYGEYLLRKALAVYAARGFKLVDLGVDTGNESGALRLYEKVGFRTVTTWVQYED